MKKLFILGNGFDIASGLPTRYDDFRNWFINNHELDYDTLNRRVREVDFYDLAVPEVVPKEELMKPKDEKEFAEFFYASVEYANYRGGNDVTWRDFESNLPKLPFEQFDDSYYNFTNYKDYEEDDDFERAENVEQLGTNLANMFIDSVGKYFTDWIKSIHLNEEIIHTKKLIVDNKQDSVFLVFNYTNLLEKIYKIPNNQICNIHGSLSEGDRLIFGHGEKMSDDDDFDPFDIFCYIIQAKNALRKRTDEIISNNSSFFENLGTLKEIYIIGWNLSDPNYVDAPYLQEVVSHTNEDTIIYFDKHDEKKQQNYKKTCICNGFKGKFGISDSEKGEKFVI